MRIRQLFLAMLVLLFVACRQKPPKTEPAKTETAATVVDSCAIAKPFELAKELEASVAPGYTGVVNKYGNVKSGRLVYQHFFVNGKIVKSVFYFDNGKMHEEYSYKCGALHGYRKVYAETGKLVQLIPFSYGYLQGTGQLFDEKGNLREQLTFVHDTIADRPKLFSDTGNIYTPAAKVE